jgi:hypothetical protein
MLENHPHFTTPRAIVDRSPVYRLAGIAVTGGAPSSLPMPDGESRSVTDASVARDDVTSHHAAVICWVDFAGPFAHSTVDLIAHHSITGGCAMRFVLHISLPVEKFNQAVRDGTAGEKMRQILEETKPEAAYFCAKDGKRGGS